MKYRLPKASTQFIHIPSVCGLLWFGWFGVFPDHHIPPYTEAQRMFADQIRLDPSFGGLSFLFGEGSGPLRRG